MPITVECRLKNINRNGNTLWEKIINGNAVNSDSIGGVILTIPKSGTGFIQRFNSDGYPLWSDEGVIYFTDKRPESYPVIISDKDHGAIIAWYEIVPERGVWIQQVNKDGFLGVAANVAIDYAFNFPKSCILYQNYPNPFNISTWISYEIFQVENVTISIYNLVGKEVRLLCQKKHSPGRYHIDWDGKNSKGGDVPNGTYFCLFKSDNQSGTKKIILLR